MGYGVLKALRLHARDQVFFAKYLLRRALHPNDEMVVLCNSYPKSGTHLLFQILSAVPNLTPSNDIVAIRSLSRLVNMARHIRWKLGSAPPRSIVRSHLIHCPEVLQILSERYRKFFIERDLRDNALSHARWVLKEPLCR